MTPLIGIQNIEKKMSDNRSREAGSDPSSLFPLVGYWNPSLRTDANGRATITFRVPEKPTVWRVLVMAVTSGERMGIGEGRFTVHPATELLPPEPAAYLIQRP